MIQYLMQYQLADVTVNRAVRVILFYRSTDLLWYFPSRDHFSKYCVKRGWDEACSMISLRLRWKGGDTHLLFGGKSIKIERKYILSCHTALQTATDKKRKAVMERLCSFVFFLKNPFSLIFEYIITCYIKYTSFKYKCILLCNIYILQWGEITFFELFYLLCTIFKVWRDTFV